MGDLRDRIRHLAREEARSYARRMSTLEEVRASMVEARGSGIRVLREPWEFSVSIGRSPWASPSRFAATLIDSLAIRGHRFRVYQEGCNGRDRRPFRGRVKHGYDLVCKLDRSRAEIRLRIELMGIDEPSRTCLVGRNVDKGLMGEIGEILRDVRSSPWQIKPSVRRSHRAVPAPAPCASVRS